MKQEKKSRKVVKEAIGDPAFYSDQINSKNEPVREGMESKGGASSRSGNNSKKK